VLSQTVEYALRASLYIARQSPRSVRGTEVAKEIQAPRNYLSKVLGQLTRNGVLESTRGRNGGFRLARDADRHTLAQIVAIFEPGEVRRCLLGGEPCTGRPGCTVHARWTPIARATNDFFAETRIADLLSFTAPVVARPTATRQHGASCSVSPLLR
jgi:Rrf2 family protein